jgi:flagellar motor switch protein FliN/FliY
MGEPEMDELEQGTPSSQASGEEPVNPGASASRPASGSVSGKSSAAPLLMGVKLPIRVLLGRTELCLRDIAQLGNGAVVELDCSPDDPVEIIVNDRVIAHGEVVVVAGNYGVRITKIASHRENGEQEGGAADLFSLSDKLR